MRTGTRISIWVVLIASSLGLHVAAFGGLGNGQSDGRQQRSKKEPTFVEMTVAPKEPPPAPEPTPEPARAPARAPKLAMARPARVNNPVAPRPAAQPEAETAADFTGTTLTNDGPGAGWSSATGNGEAMRGPVGRAGAKVTGRNVDGAAASGAPVVGLGNLSRPPEPPNLAASLERQYPTEARRKGQGGTAKVRLRVMPDGAVAELAVAFESSPGFGQACKLTLRGSRWTPPLDRGGQAVSTYVQYTCNFEVR